MLAELLVGVLLALGCAYVVRALARGHELPVYAVGLFGAALVYLVFAFAAGASAGWLWVELGGLAFFGGFALFALRTSALFVGLGWGLHVLWDAALHGLLSPDIAPSWYPSLCAGFDLTLAVYIPWALHGRPAPSSARTRHAAS